MHKIITMSDKNYFDAGKLFLKTRNRVNADVLLYGPDITGEQIRILKENDISYEYVDPNTFKNKMQFLKFDFLSDQLFSFVHSKKYSGFTFVDWDTFIINDWEHIFEYDFDFGITIRNDQVKKKVLRAYANGGVMFAKYSAYDFLDETMKIIEDGKSRKLPEYNEIWKTLEEGRPENKTHYRTELRWWVDQVYISSLTLRYFKKNGDQKIGLEPKIFKFGNTKIGLFGCDYYNKINSSPKITNEKNVYIKHLKNVGRDSLGLKKIKEKL